MVIDDEQMIVKGLSKLIPWHHLGYELVGTAFSGKSALQTLKALDPDVIVSDIQLGDTTGLDLLKEIHKTHPGILFIFISGYDDFSYCQSAIANGAVDYLLKPVDMDYLGQVLVKCKTRLEDRRILDHTDRISFNYDQDTEETDDKLIHNIKAYIDANYHEDIDIAAISNQFYIGQTYFSELFKKEFGINFKKYLTQMRIEKAKRYIIETDYKISDIASKVGYEDPGYFSQVFRKLTGLTPRQFKVDMTDKGDLT